ncbi:MAG TPA: hypothetical protein PLS95_16450 [Thermoanaerobaculales bacterium]|nr:hypothetical protein [Thermoanaerobaculales bacterium]HQP42841.1 hypothetical protein [Thermoanaerobaculales bacterium]
MTHVVKMTDPAVSKLKVELADLWASQAGLELRALEDDETRFETDASLRALGVSVPDRRPPVDLERKMVAAVNAALGSHATRADYLRNAPRPANVAAAVREVVDAAEWVRDASRELLRAINLSHDRARRDKRVGLASVVRNLDETTRAKIREALEAAGVDPATVLDEDLVTRAVNGFAKLGAALNVAIEPLEQIAVPRKQSRGRPRTTEALRQTIARLEQTFARFDGGDPKDRDRRRHRFVDIALGVAGLERPAR